ncbi:hypothetical protein ALI144C_26280 [Actinosynnema sp. ALI-1.44]|uniref:DUF397 domain-containing protein n=1 Tax=Actinosynnema sp. ALI-1.44 TaxID=1933779 RepID=UPI00097C9C93|nr:DUF397 domain-containing protein [Actinosynnema sp. ALI-1.44]ONI79332.1 hypothetical protein ALI144C_26280 [Actinosynnema sp. ALI-1.44]
MNLETARWRKSSYSGSESACVEVALVPGAVAIRDTKNRDAGALVLATSAWRALTGYTSPASL